MVANNGSGKWTRREEREPRPDKEQLKDQVAAKLLAKLKAGIGDAAPTRVEVASHGDSISDRYVLFDLHYDNGKAGEGHHRMNHDWAATAIEFGGHGSSCIPHGDKLVQASIQGITLDKFNYEIDKRTQIGSLRR